MRPKNLLFKSFLTSLGPKRLSIIYSFRNRDVEIVKTSLDSLKEQTYQGFEVIFVDFGSDYDCLKKVRDLLQQYSFVRLLEVPVNGKLWSRSMAMNVGIRAAKYDLIFIVDIDLYFQKEVISGVLSEFKSGSFFGGDWHFLDKEDSLKLLSDPRKFSPKNFKLSDDNGMILLEKAALYHIWGYDEFFHLYGGEDTDLKYRLKVYGLKHEKLKTQGFYHMWHPHVIQKRQRELSKTPFAFNIKRINEKHVFYNQKYQLLKPLGQENWGIVDGIPNEIDVDEKIQISNIHAYVLHFFNFELKRKSGLWLEITIRDISQKSTLKSRIKSFLKPSTDPLISMQEVNELITAKLIFDYRDNPYRYLIDQKNRLITLLIRT